MGLFEDKVLDLEIFVRMEFVFCLDEDVDLEDGVF